MRVELVPATEDDFIKLIGRKPDWRVRGIAAKLEGRTIGLGGATFLPDGTTAAFMIVTDEARKYPTAIWRAGKAAIALFKKLGLKKVVALADDNIESARPWLLRLGFEPANGKYAYIWKNK